MQYCVMTYTTNAEGRMVNKSTIACVNFNEANAMVEMLRNGFNCPEVNRTAIVCATGYSQAGKYLIPLEEIAYISRKHKL